MLFLSRMMLCFLLVYLSFSFRYLRVTHTHTGGSTISVFLMPKAKLYHPPTNNQQTCFNLIDFSVLSTSLPYILPSHNKQRENDWVELSETERKRSERKLITLLPSQWNFGVYVACIEKLFKARGHQVYDFCRLFTWLNLNKCHEWNCEHDKPKIWRRQRRRWRCWIDISLCLYVHCITAVLCCM